MNYMAYIISIKLFIKKSQRLITLCLCYLKLPTHATLQNMPVGHCVGKIQFFIFKKSLFRADRARNPREVFTMVGHFENTSSC
jgi:hypothetical protein